MKPVLTKYRVLKAWRYQRHRFIDDDYALIIECRPGIIDRMKGHSVYKFCVVGHKGMWYYAKFEEKERSYEVISVSSNYMHYSKDPFFNALLASAQRKGMVK